MADENEDERMARELGKEERKEHIKVVEPVKHGPAYREYVGHEPVHRIRSEVPQGDIHIKHPYVHQAKQVIGAGVNAVGRGVNAVDSGVRGSYHRFENWEAQRKQKEMANADYETYKHNQKVKKLELAEKQERFNQLQRVNNTPKQSYGGGYAQRPQQYQPQQGQGLSLGGGGSNLLTGGNQTQSNPLDLAANMPDWFQKGVGRQQEPQQVQPYGQKSYEYPRAGGNAMPRAPGRMYKDQEAHELAERNRMLKSKSKQLRKLARRERSIANREQALEQYKRKKQAPPPQQGQGGGSISDMLFGGGQ